jgi:DinB family protein
VTVAELRDAFEAAKADARELTAGVSEAAFNWRRAPGAWSIAECVDHLNVVGRKSLRAVDRAIEKGRREGVLGAGPFRYGLLEGWYVRSLAPPPMFRVKTPAAFVPASDVRRDEALAAFLALQDELQERLAQTEGLDLRRLKIPSPVRYLKLSLGKAFEGVAAHQRRHLWQARQVKADPAFPAS